MFSRANTLLKKKKERKKQENNLCCAFFPPSIIFPNYVLEQVAMAVRVYFIQSLVLLSVLLDYCT